MEIDLYTNEDLNIWGELFEECKQRQIKELIDIIEHLKKKIDNLIFDNVNEDILLDIIYRMREKIRDKIKGLPEFDNMKQRYKADMRKKENKKYIERHQKLNNNFNEYILQKKNRYYLPTIVYYDFEDNRVIIQ